MVALQNLDGKIVRGIYMSESDGNVTEYFVAYYKSNLMRQFRLYRLLDNGLVELKRLISADFVMKGFGDDKCNFEDRIIEKSQFGREELSSLFKTYTIFNLTDEEILWHVVAEEI